MTDNTFIARRNLRVLAQDELAPELFRLTFEYPAELPPPKPGQFMTIRCSRRSDPLLRRPFAFAGHDPERETAEIIFLRRGPATDALAGLRRGDEPDVVFPLGNSFPDIPGRSYLVAGGIGIGPIVFMARTLIHKGLAFSGMVGFRSQGAVPPGDYLSDLSLELCTDDGSAGFHGTVVDFARTGWGSFREGDAMFACGPNPMLAALHRFSIDRDVPLFVSMEQVMACGVGACMGCVIQVTDEKRYARVCSEGPVFPSTSIAWERMSL